MSSNINKKIKILILRFSSFGDVTQCLSIPSLLAKKFPQAEVHWVTKKELAILMHGHPHIDKVWALPTKANLKDLVSLIKDLRDEEFSYIYDAHNNLRSNIVCLFLLPPFHLKRFFFRPKFLRRSVKRFKRFLLFNFRINLFQMPFSGQRDFIEPLEKWGIPVSLPEPPQIFPSASGLAKAKDLLEPFRNTVFIALAPSAAHFLKRWPKDHWKSLINQLSNNKFILLGGPGDTFLEDIRNSAPERVLNLAGKSDLETSVALVEQSQLLIANDTGLLHVAEQLGKPAIALMGPAPFGFPSRPKTKILELNLSCRPCSKHGQGPCRNKIYQECLVNIQPEQVAKEVLTFFTGKQK